MLCCIVRMRAVLALLSLLAEPAVAARRSTRASAMIMSQGRLQTWGHEEGSANPIRKVVTLLHNMAKKVEQEAENEEHLYEKFQCYCKTGIVDLTQAVTDSNAKVPAVQSDIEQAESSATKLKLELEKHQADRTSAEMAMKEATALREKEHATYATDAGEALGYLDALTKAIAAVEAGLSATGLVQFRSTAPALRRAVAADTALTDDDRQAVLSFLGTSAGGAGAAGYVPKSPEVLGILKDMKDSFERTHTELESKEKETVKLYDELMAAKTKEVKALSASIEKKMGRVGELQMEIVHMKNDLSSTEAALIEDQKFLQSLEQDCDGKKGEYEERVKTRSEELSAIRETISILNDDDALDLFKKTLPSASFVQFAHGAEHARQRALSALQGRHGEHPGGRLNVRFVEFMLGGRKVDFSKVIKMVEDMLALLAQEQVDDESKKEYCDKQIDAAEDKVKDLARDAGDLETSIEERKGAIAQLADELKSLQAGIAELDKAAAEATVQRKEENEEYTQLMSSDAAAKELLQLAKERLQKFYQTKLSLAQASARHSSAAAAASRAKAQAAARKLAARREAPSPPPETWGAYQKKSEESAGVLDMINTLIRDLEKEMAEAEKQEEMSQKAYEDLMSESAKKRATDQKSVQVKQSSKADSEEMIMVEKGDLSTTKKEYLATERYLKELHADCDWLVQNFDLRKSARAEEMDALKDAKAVLSGADYS